MRARSAVLLAGGVGYSLVAASTTPFTLPADVLTGLAIVAMAVLVGVRWPLRPRRARPISASSSSTSSSSSSSSSSSTTGHPYLLWVLLLTIFVAWELFNYLVHGTRANHPTFSSITDAIDRFYLLKALLFLGWLAAALVIVGRGSRAGLRSHSRPG